MTEHVQQAGKFVVRSREMHTAAKKKIVPESERIIHLYKTQKKVNFDSFGVRLNPVGNINEDPNCRPKKHSHSRNRNYNNKSLMRLIHQLHF